MSIEQKTLTIENINIGGDTQSRTSLNNEVLAEYVQAINDGAVFPPIVVFYDGSDYWLADGFHRYFASKQAGKTGVQAVVHNGTKRDAVLYSLTEANKSHGLRLSNEDKRKRVLALLNDAEWSTWSDREIARKAGVDNKTVSNYRNAICGISTDTAQPETRTVIRNGTEYQQDTSNIGRKAEVATPKEDVGVSITEKNKTVITENAGTQTKPLGANELSEEEMDAVLHDNSTDLLAEAHKEIESLQRQLNALKTDDLSAKVVEQEVRYSQLEGRLGFEMEKTSNLNKELRYFGKLTESLRKETGATENKEILSWIQNQKSRMNELCSVVGLDSFDDVLAHIKASRL